MLSHPFIVQGKKVFVAKKHDLVTILEYCHEKDLASWYETNRKDESELLKKRVDYLDQDTILTWVTQLALALEDTHTNKMNHRNMSSEHIFLKREDPNNPDSKLVAMLGNYGNAII